MDAVSLARLQFGLTVAFHFLFPPITIGLSWLISYMAWRHLRTGEKIYDQMTQFWLKVFAMLFAAGVATGITMEFQFGTNWSTYSRYVGDIFGSPLAAEGVFAFFLESSFMAVLLFGKTRVSRRFYALSALMVSLGSTLSAFWIIVANSWMQTPTAYQIVGEGASRRAELTDFWAAVFNPSTIPRYTHTVVASLLAGAFFMAGTSAWYLLKGRHQEFARRSLQIGLVTAAVASLLVLGIGHYHSIQVGETQPAKMAAFEGLFKTQAGAPLTLFGIPDTDNQKLHLSIQIPKALSLLMYFDANATVTGLDQFPRDEWPPVTVTFYSYHIMFILGMFFIFLSWWGIFLREKRYANKLFLRAMLYSLPLPLLAIELGWMAAEFGRQPWAVQGLLKTEDAVSVVVPSGQIFFTIVLFTLVYAAILGLLIFLVRKKFKHGPEPIPAAEEVSA